MTMHSRIKTQINVGRTKKMLEAGKDIPEIAAELKVPEEVIISYVAIIVKSIVAKM